MNKSVLASNLRVNETVLASNLLVNETVLASNLRVNVNYSVKCLFTITIQTQLDTRDTRAHVTTENRVILYFART